MRNGDLLDLSCARVRLVFLGRDCPDLFIGGGSCAMLGFGWRS